MKIIIEENIPYIKGRLESFADVYYLPNEQITPQMVHDADALIVRTRTKCNASLLDGSRCKFIGTATIGTDHIDLNYCRTHGIHTENAPGCNAPAVAQYVISTIGHWMKKEGIDSTANLTLGIVGVGHVGSIIQRWAKEVGLNVLLNDPPRERTEKNDGIFSPLNELAEKADIITFHTPLIKAGDDATFHLADAAFLGHLKKCRLLINSARGPIVDNIALAESVADGHSSLSIAIDCWENEPNINSVLLDKAYIATPHIAGYSAEGKTRATAMVLQALKSHFGWNIDIPCVKTPLKGATNVTLDAVMDSYNPLHDTATLKSTPQTFEAQRNHYNLRHEVEDRS